MININLLPVRQIKQKAAARRQLTTFFLIFLMCLGALAIAAFLHSSIRNQLQNDISRLTQEKQSYAKTLNLIKELEKKKALLEKRISIIKKLKKSSSLTVHVLDEVARSTPADRLWLTSLSQQGHDLKISGMALDNRTIARFMDDLKASPYISDVNLASTSLKTYAERDLKSFSLTCTVTVPSEDKEEEPENK